MANRQDITSKEVYELIDKMRVEVTNSIKQLEDKFDTMVLQRVNGLAERLTKVEGSITELKTEYAPIKKLVYGCVGTILFAVLSAIVVLIIKK